jgi:hypothetical protein
VKSSRQQLDCLAMPQKQKAADDNLRQVFQNFSFENILKKPGKFGEFVQIVMV